MIDIWSNDHDSNCRFFYKTIYDTENNVHFIVSYLYSVKKIILIHKFLDKDDKFYDN